MKGQITLTKTNLLLFVKTQHGTLNYESDFPDGMNSFSL